MCDTARQKNSVLCLKPSTIEKDERSIQAIVNLLENNWANPSDNRNTELVSLSSGAVPSESICNDLTKTQEIGEHAFQMFVTEWLERSHPSRKFTDPIRKQKLYVEATAGSNCRPDIRALRIVFFTSLHILQVIRYLKSLWSFSS